MWHKKAFILWMLLNASFLSIPVLCLEIPVAYLLQNKFIKNSNLVKLQIAPRRGRPSLEALACVGNIAKAMGPAMETHVCSLLDAMFSAGLSSVLVESLEQITIRYTGFKGYYCKFAFYQVLKNNHISLTLSASHHCCLPSKIGCLKAFQ